MPALRVQTGRLNLLVTPWRTLEGGTRVGRGIRTMERDRDSASAFRGRRREGIRISLLGGFQLEDEGAAIVLPEGAQRLLAFLALRGRLVRRPVAVGTQEPAATET